MKLNYDYIICGAGLAGLSLAANLIHSGKLNDKQILLVDNKEKNTNDRTWCFWEKQDGLFEDIVYRKWKRVWLRSEKFSKVLDLSPYEYKMIRGIDFYNYCLDLISRQANVELLQCKVESINSDARGTWAMADGKKITADYIFNSILFNKPALKKNEYWMQQHFKGWVIESNENIFDPSLPTLMDFRVRPQQGTSFVYTMPFSGIKALVEYTVFSASALQPGQYDVELKEYISNFLTSSDYIIREEEQGIIPMTNHRFSSRQGNIINIGTAGGQTKPSTGYTFRFIQKHTASIVDGLILDGKPFTRGPKKRFHFYDSVFLDILDKNKVPGTDIFTALFKKNKPRHVLRFLDNESTFTEELKIISSLPTFPFLRAALGRL